MTFVLPAMPQKSGRPALTSVFNPKYPVNQILSMTHPLSHASVP
jgi:hypothetical protein